VFKTNEQRRNLHDRQTGSVLSAEKERKGPAEEVLQAYAAHMRDILQKNGLLK
jgi:hypothetical protein